MSFLSKIKYNDTFLEIVVMHKQIRSPISFWGMTVEEARQMILQRIVSIEAETPQVGSVRDIEISNEGRSTLLRIYSPEGECQNLPVALLIHGGAWVAGNLDTHDNLARYLCQKAHVLIVSVDYSNAPEGKFPLPLEQCYDALLWSVNHASDFHGNSEKLAVIGDSAGGNMSAALCLLVRDRGGPKISLQVLINPAPDLTGDGTIEPQGDLKDAVRWYATQYVSDPEEVNNPYVSPIMSKNLMGLPPAVIILAEKDDLREDGQRYADRLKEAGIPTQVYIQMGIGHLAGDCARASQVARESLDIAVKYLKSTF